MRCNGMCRLPCSKFIFVCCYAVLPGIISTIRISARREEEERLSSSTVADSMPLPSAAKPGGEQDSLASRYVKAVDRTFNDAAASVHDHIIRDIQVGKGWSESSAEHLKRVEAMVHKAEMASAGHERNLHRKPSEMAQDAGWPYFMILMLKQQEQEAQNPAPVGDCTNPDPFTDCNLCGNRRSCLNFQEDATIAAYKRLRSLFNELVHTIQAVKGKAMRRRALRGESSSSRRSGMNSPASPSALPTLDSLARNLDGMMDGAGLHSPKSSSNTPEAYPMLGNVGRKLGSMLDAATSRS
eukprot:gnl/TRDRNA2_/TRDRNA2_39536_c0_seq1.p1 gnl/TRDRNA2_/TRDRNA2_39536_c0~~gnl/TRDRNA2_/TRDRNA2_39536_c0_seq1.p1  ORF type:complete len:316 (+),score=31.32 gnl/TRDRNA2_/TRDRNA2_39536_c0_seq1:59-949(+)